MATGKLLLTLKLINCIHIIARAQLYKVVESEEEERRREYRQDGMDGEECQG